ETEVTSGGWLPESEVALQLTDAAGDPVGQPVTVTTDGEGNVPAGTVLPVPEDAAPGEYTVVGTDPDGASAEAPVEVYAPAVEATSPVPAGGETEVTSGGWLPESEVALQLTDAAGDPVGQPVTVTTDGEGNVPAGTVLPVPADAEPGEYTVVGTDPDGASAEAPIEVYWPTMEAETPVAPGDCSVITSGGWLPNSEVTLQLVDAEGNPVGDPVVVTTDGEGNVPADTCVEIPEGTEPGDYEIIGEDDNGGQVSTPVEITEPDAITPSVSVDPAEVEPGGSTTVTGEGYTPDSTVTVQLVDGAGDPVGDPVPAETDAAGAFTVDLPVPEDAEPGEYTVVGTDDTTGEAAEAPLAVTDGSGGGDGLSVSVDPAEVEPGGSTTVTGEGYAPNAPVTVELVGPEGNVVATLPAETDAAGAFTVDLPVPEDAEPGEYTVVGTDDTTGEAAEAPLAVTDGSGGGIDPTISVEPADVFPGQEATVSGEGYTPNATVTLQLVDAEGTVVSEEQVETDENGSFTLEGTVPEEFLPGDYTVIGTDDTTGEAAEAPVTVLDASAGPVVSATSPVPAGGSTEVASGGWAPQYAVTLQLVDGEGNPVGDQVEVMTDGDGIIPAGTTLAIPADVAAGEYTVVATGADGDEASTTIEVYAPHISATTPVPTGGETEVTSGGWLPETRVTVRFGNPIGEPVLVMTDANGEFVVTLPVPDEAVVGETYDLSAVDANGAEAATPVQVVAADGGDGDGDGTGPSIIVEPDEVDEGGSIEVIGEDFPPNTDVIVEVGDDSGPLCPPIEVTTDDEGSFTTTLELCPAVGPGDYLVVASPADGSPGATADLTVLGAGDGGGDGSGDGDDTGGGSLPDTGADVASLTLLAMTMLVGGAILLRTRRRARSHSSGR
ncbi:MG2 domain-containing protein, partial [Georgenia alba]